LYFSFFSSYANEENNTDNDFFLASATVEAEKEIGSFDDLILMFVTLLYVFG
jgi:hypothetical protein